MDVPDELIAKYIDGRTSDEENRVIMDAVACVDDLWTLQKMVASDKDCGSSAI
ncbi:MAG: hypothetical protein IJX44_04495 [Bacteroidaceae bacterium]|nr:hypothetical protein [Bacteroidaceae bacterium]